MSPRKGVEFTYRVGQHVYVRGGNGVVESINDDGTVTVRMAWGEALTVHPGPDIAPRI